MLCRILGFIAFSFYEGRGWEGGTLCILPNCSPVSSGAMFVWRRSMVGRSKCVCCSLEKFVEYDVACSMVMSEKGNADEDKNQRPEYGLEIAREWHESASQEIESYRQ